MDLIITVVASSLSIGIAALGAALITFAGAGYLIGRMWRAPGGKYKAVVRKR